MYGLRMGSIGFCSSARHFQLEYLVRTVNVQVPPWFRRGEPFKTRCPSLIHNCKLFFGDRSHQSVAARHDRYFAT